MTQCYDSVASRRGLAKAAQSELRVPWWKYTRQPSPDRRHTELRRARRPALSLT
ncbi:ribosomal protein L39E [Nonomuraea roseoviolacea subsp. carminata]|uniref:Ribosomal protein L39E n=1 Tax=Nonomuraea roseoviolacea subsp. carminata TaxID=160689 RepID=A0ABT1JSF5_9ACTN|nr:ribosomal protein L39E [Nonomuraea roseoviolacea subsp. carminata]